MTIENVACPVCGSSRTIDCGPPAHHRPHSVAGASIELSDLNLRHRRCPDCEYQFVYPRIPQERLIDCYTRAAVGFWGTAGMDLAEARSYGHKMELLEQYAPLPSAPTRNVLDFGCFDGGFLEYLGPGWSRFGIEPSTQAAAVAEQRGVRLIGSTLDTVKLDENADRFAAIIIFDVMEHIPDPVADLTALCRMLAPGGIVLIETGNTDARDWKRFGKRHPYAGFIEHIGFFNRRSIETAGQRAGFALAHFEQSVHMDYREGAKKHWRHVWTYRAIRQLDALHVPLSQRLKDIAAGPVPRTIDPRDHFLAVLRRA